MNNSLAYIAGTNLPLVTLGKGKAYGTGACLLSFGGITCAGKD